MTDAEVANADNPQCRTLDAEGRERDLERLETFRCGKERLVLLREAEPQRERGRLIVKKRGRRDRRDPALLRQAQSEVHILLVGDRRVVQQLEIRPTRPERLPSRASDQIQK